MIAAGVAAFAFTFQVGALALKKTSLERRRRAKPVSKAQPVTKGHNLGPVSYTHLTLPTILLV
eukprot:2954982-Amphidinium_carterae.1